MSLYSFSKPQSLPPVKNVPGIRITSSSDATLLASMAGTSVQNVRARFAGGHKAFVAYIYDEPAAFGWMATEEATIGELNHQIKLPESHRYLWNFRTLENFRGLGIYPTLLQYIINTELTAAARFWIIHAPENRASLHGIVKAGFQFVGTIYINREGVVTVNAETDPADAALFANAMDIQTSSAIPASCWNCSSPYLSKRSADCCCAKSQHECVGKDDRLLSL